MSKPKISVVLSFYNEGAVLEELIKRLEKAFTLTDCDHELIFVNDASTDRSKEILLEKAQHDRRIKIITMSRPFGVSPCVLAGMEYSTGDAVIYMDADLQDPPELIPEMIKTWREGGCEIVNTKRRSRAGESGLKMFITAVGYAILTKVSDIGLEKEEGDFKLLSRRAVKELIRLKEIRPFTRGMVKWIGFKQQTLVYDREARFAGDTKFLAWGWRVISNFLDSALISFSDLPLKLSLFLGFLVSAGAFFYLFIIFIMKFMGIAMPGWSAIMATMLVLGGIQLLTIGVLGLYINAIFIETKRRPNFIIESTYGIEK